MFAASTQSRMYHLIEVGRQATLCGVRVTMILEAEPISSALHLVANEPPGYFLCHHCLRLNETRFQTNQRAPSY
jgi:hypothetical protein